MFQSLIEQFQAPDQEFESFKIFLHEADCSSLRLLDGEVFTTVEHTQRTFTPNALKRAQMDLQQQFVTSEEVWQKWQAMISLLTELAVRFNFVSANSFFSCLP